jgi:NAD(P)-dependent dehydrogenase (short-subunit alcohol dehydrogenase family)
MKRILVTGANKGIGLAIVEGILLEHDDCHVFLGARDPARGAAARESLSGSNSDWSERVEVLELDVTSDASLERAATALCASAGDESQPLFGLVNNAGTAEGSLAEVLEVNTYGMHRVCETMLPLLQDGGRVVNVTSASGPNFVSECSADQQQFLLDPELDWSRLDAFMRECLTLGEDEFAARGLGSGASYGLSKACANAYSQSLARAHPRLVINACTPGFIETDLTRQLAHSSGRSPQELGLKSPAEGARVVLFLLFGDPEGSGHYYGSDCRRSPLDRYRAPGTPAYRGQ